MANVRTFVAVPLTPETRAALATAAEELRQPAAGLPVAWVAPENFHITLKFLGGVEEARLQSVMDALHTAAAPHAPFEVEVGGLGAFPSAARARVLWAGVAAGEGPLAAVAASVDTALAALGFPRDERAFSAHVTVARVREPRRAPALAEALGVATAKRFGRIPVHEVTVMRSDLSPRGARYTPLATLPLSG